MALFPDSSISRSSSIFFRARLYFLGIVALFDDVAPYFVIDIGAGQIACHVVHSATILVNISWLFRFVSFSLNDHDMHLPALFLSVVDGNNRAVWEGRPMSELQKKEGDHGIVQWPEAEAIQAPDAQAARNAEMSEVKAAQAQNRNAHSGSAGGDQDQSIEIIAVKKSGVIDLLASRLKANKLEPGPERDKHKQLAREQLVQVEPRAQGELDALDEKRRRVSEQEHAGIHDIRELRSRPLQGHVEIPENPWQAFTELRPDQQRDIIKGKSRKKSLTKLQRHLLIVITCLETMILKFVDLRGFTVASCMNYCGKRLATMI